ncbi:hypothetical protein LTR09_012780 [Extremus antarcticus]|uniref:Uncharacterized protein n=1 Tax=Extremus antarcticus TaxID=702011 RepID=A0AAJ0G6J1_9PEZI|nr:hypothetical protein LTR09_012780 [Extremus antarcticus]
MSSGQLVTNVSLEWIDGKPDQFCDRDGVEKAVPPRAIAFDSYDLDRSRTGAKCTARTTYVETMARCTRNEHAAMKSRRSRMPHFPPEFTFMDSHSSQAWQLDAVNIMGALEDF